MPWCAGCDRFLSPSTVTTTGACPRCGAPVDPGRARAPDAAAPPAPADPAVPAAVSAEATPVADESDTDTIPLPWHFKLLVGAIALYLGWRAVQGVEWVVHQF